MKEFTCLDCGIEFDDKFNNSGYVYIRCPNCGSQNYMDTEKYQENKKINWQDDQKEG